MELKDCEEKLQKQFDIVDDIAFFNQKKVLDAFVKNKVTSQCFAGTTGYGYDDVGRDTLAKVYADVFGGESAIVSPLITCGSHAITIVLFGLLRPNDVLLSATGNLYDTLSDTLLGKNNVIWLEIILTRLYLSKKSKNSNQRLCFSSVAEVIASEKPSLLMIWKVFSKR